MENRDRPSGTEYSPHLRHLSPAAELLDVVLLGLHLDLHHGLLLLQPLYLSLAALPQRGHHIFMLRAILLRGFQALLQV